MKEMEKKAYSCPACSVIKLHSQGFLAGSMQGSAGTDPLDFGGVESSEHTVW